MSCQGESTRNVRNGCGGSARIVGRKEIRDGVPYGVDSGARGACKRAGYNVVAGRVLDGERERRLVGGAGEDVDQVALHVGAPVVSRRDNTGGGEVEESEILRWSLILIG